MANDVMIAGIILAAGGSKRMGHQKLLLTFEHETLIHHAARIALQGGLDPVIVVTGADSKSLLEAVADLPVQIIHNPDWESGQSTSVISGVRALPSSVQAAVFVLGDQPFVSADLIQNLISTYLDTRPTILAPFVGTHRGNPVLFDRSTFVEILALQGDTGPRVLFATHPPAVLPWTDERLLLDIDTPEDLVHLEE